MRVLGKDVGSVLAGESPRCARQDSRGGCPHTSNPRTSLPAAVPTRAIRGQACRRGCPHNQITDTDTGSAALLVCQGSPCWGYRASSRWAACRGCRCRACPVCRECSRCRCWLRPASAAAVDAWLRAEVELGALRLRGGSRQLVPG